MIDRGANAMPSSDDASRRQCSKSKYETQQPAFGDRSVTEIRVVALHERRAAQQHRVQHAKGRRVDAMESANISRLAMAKPRSRRSARSAWRKSSHRPSNHAGQRCEAILS